MNGDVATGKYKYVVSTQKASLTHPDGKLREEIVVYGRKYVEQLLRQKRCNGIKDVLTGLPAFVYAHYQELQGSWEAITLEDMMKLQEAYPKAELLQGATKDLIMQMMLMLDKEAFIDAEKNECHFDSQQFKNLLKFANKFPKEYDYTNGYQLPPLLLKDNRLQTKG